MNRHTCLSFGQWVAGGALLVVAVVLSGCGIGEPAASVPVTMQGTFKGIVYGGQQSVVGAKVYLYAAGSGTGASAYGGAGIAASSSNASVSLLTNVPGKTQFDGTNYYITTDSSGAFLLTGNYNCTAGQQLYVYVTGGNPGGGANSAVGMMAIAGQCPLTTVPFIWVNEVSTIAAAYSFAGFATDPTHVSSSSTNATGIANAFASATNLVNVGTGVAATTTAGSNGTPPTLEINTLANIISDCINSVAPSTQCTTLFSNAMSAGLSGTAPTDTATAAINIAHYPGVSSTQVHNLYGLQAGVATPFNNHLTSQPNDFTVAVKYTGGGMGTGTNQGWAIATDGSGNVWVANSGNNTVTELNSQGKAVSPGGGYTGGGLARPQGIAVDLNGVIWIADNGPVYGMTKMVAGNGTVSSANFFMVGGVADPGAVAVDASDNIWLANDTNSTTSSVTGVNNSGVALTNSPYNSSPSLGSTFCVAVDHAGNIWLGDSFNNKTVKMSVSAGTATFTGYSSGSGTVPESIAIDSGGNAWTANSGTGTASKVSSTGTLSGPYTVGTSSSAPYGIAIDGGGNAWVVNNATNNLAELTNSGTALSLSTGYLGGVNPINSPFGIALDGSGNVWIVNDGEGSVVEFVGAAVPVVTPIALAVKNNTLGTRP